MFAHEQSARDIEHARQLSRTRYFWWVNYLTDYTGWDFLWEPVPWESQYTHTWPSQWHDYSGTYLVPKHADGINYKFHNRVLPNQVNQHNFKTLVDGDIEFDWTWAPHPHDPPYIYVFGNQWHRAEIMSTLEYCVPGATERKYINYPQAQLLPRHDNHWRTLMHCDWDYSWRPDPGDPPYIYVFGNQWYPAEVMPTVEYHMPGASERKYMGYPRAELMAQLDAWAIPNGINADDFDFSWCPDPGSPPYIYEFGTQWQKTGGPIYTVPGACEHKYMPYPRAVKNTQDSHWQIPAGADVESFDWTWHPDATEQAYIYQFGTQHQRTGGPQYHVPGATEVKYVDQIRIRTQRVATAIIEIDHMDGNTGHIADTARTVRYFDNYLDTLRRIAKGIGHEHEFVWICSSICDYTDFDFSWHPEQWQATMLHVFASDEQKFGDTFFMHVPSFLQRSERLELLEWYDINFITPGVNRRPMPVIINSNDTHVDSVKLTPWPGPLALFTTGHVPARLPTVALWREKTKTVVPLDAGAECVIVPRTAVPCIRTQLYDYAHIDKSHRGHPAQPQDVIFISNGESMAEDNWQHLKAMCPRARRSDGVTGREAAYKAAAALSDTPWFYAVFAKTEVMPDFAFDYAPDRMQQPKHYIFHSRNPVNGLEYGAMNINLYNRQLVLDTVPGLDFTLSAAHEVVPICASISRFNTDPWVTWRSAFREVLKLKREVDLGADVEIQHRLRVWTTQAQGENAQHCLQGAQDALAYYEKVGGRLEDLQLSFDWAWLQDYYYSLYQQQPWLESV